MAHIFTSLLKPMPDGKLSGKATHRFEVTVTGRRDLDHLQRLLSAGDPPVKGGQLEALLAYLPTAKRVTLSLSPEQWQLLQQSYDKKSHG